MKLKFSLETFDSNSNNYTKRWMCLSSTDTACEVFGSTNGCQKLNSFPSCQSGGDNVVPESSSLLGLSKHLKLCYCLWELMFIDAAACYLGRTGQSHPEVLWFGILAAPLMYLGHNK